MGEVGGYVFPQDAEPDDVFFNFGWEYILSERTSRCSARLDEAFATARTARPISRPCSGLNSPSAAIRKRGTPTECRPHALVLTP